MAAFNPTNQQTITTNVAFIPELWSDEVLASYEKSLVLAPAVRKLSMKGKKGDTIHIPVPGRDNASEKAKNTAVTLVDDTATLLDIVVNRHYEWSKMIEDIAEIQSLASARRFYTEDAGYALAREVDSYLALCSIGWGSGASIQVPTDPTVAGSWQHSHCLQIDEDAAASLVGTLELYNSAQTPAAAAANEFTDISMRNLCQRLDSLDVPMTGRVFAVHPVLVEAIRGIDRYNSVDFVNHKGVVNGEIGNIYGVSIRASTNLPDGDDATNGLANGTKAHLFFHKDALVLVEQLGIRSQTQYKQEFLSDLFTADRIYGAREYRDTNGIILVTTDA